MRGVLVREVIRGGPAIGGHLLHPVVSPHHGSGWRPQMTGPAEIRPLPVASLLCDPANPRLGEDVENHREALRSIWRNNTNQILNLAEDIAKHGLIPFMNLFVASHTDEEMFVVLEGNRRTAAIKALQSPEIVDDLLTPKQRTRLKNATKLPNVPGEANCAVAEDDESVNMWIERRHSGQLEGRGLIPWGPLQLARFRSRTLGEQHPTLMVMDFVIEHGDLEKSVVDGLDASFNFTNFERFVDSVLARRFMGLDFDRDDQGKRQIKLLGPEDEVVRIWEKVFRLVETKKLNVSEIKTVEQQLQYLRNLGDDLLPDPTKMESDYKTVLGEVDAKLGLGGSQNDSGGDGTGKDGDAGSDDGDEDEGTGAGAGSGGTSSDGAKSTGDGKGSGDASGSKGKSGSGASGGKGTASRTKLIPADCNLDVRPPRVWEVYHELQKLPVKLYRNSTAVLLRVFVELSLDMLNEEEDDLYTPPKPQASWKKMPLEKKVKRAIDWLEAQGHLTSDGAKAARKAFDSQVLKESSITVLNSFVHNKNMFPDADGLKTAWDNIQPFMVALWNTRPAPKPGK